MFFHIDQHYWRRHEYSEEKSLHKTFSLPEFHHTGDLQTDDHIDHQDNAQIIQTERTETIPSTGSLKLKITPPSNQPAN